MICSGGGEVQSDGRVATRGEICTRTRSRVRGKAGTIAAAAGSRGVRPLTTECGPPPTREISPILRRAGRSCPNSTNDSIYHSGMLPPPSIFILRHSVILRTFIPLATAATAMDSGTRTRRWSSGLGPASDRPGGLVTGGSLHRYANEVSTWKAERIYMSSFGQRPIPPLDRQELPSVHTVHTRATCVRVRSYVGFSPARRAAEHTKHFPTAT